MCDGMEARAIPRWSSASAHPAAAGMALHKAVRGKWVLGYGFAWHGSLRARTSPVDNEGEGSRERDGRRGISGRRGVRVRRVIEREGF